MRIGWRRAFGAGLALLAACSAPSEQAARRLPDDLTALCRPPAGMEKDFGPFRSPLLFADGSRATTPEQWARRRAEILETWQRIMGPWPALIEAPVVEVLETERVEGLTRERVRLGIALGGEPVDGFLLRPDGPGPFPAVLVLYYDAQTGVGLGAKQRDFALQLARRGFVALSLGKPNAGVDLVDPSKARGGPYLGPSGKPVLVQPLSALAYAAANAHTALARRPEVDPARIGVVGHSFGGKWALFAGCLHEKFACAVWSDPGIVFDERDRRKQNPSGSVNYWDVWYLGFERGQVNDPAAKHAFRKLPSEGQARTGAYRELVDGGHDLVELHALMAPRPFLVSGGSADLPERWPALNHAIEVNRLLGAEHRVAMANRGGHDPTEESNGQIYRFFGAWLRDR
jgi:dienelactone hydrolase